MDPKSLIYGDGIPVTIEYESTQVDQQGTTHATVTGTDRDGNDPLNIHDWENSDDIEPLNRDRNNVQTRGPVVKKHVHVYVPIPRLVLKGIQDTFANRSLDISSLHQDLLEEAKREGLISEDTSEAPETITMKGDDFSAVVSVPSGEEAEDGILGYSSVVHENVEEAGESYSKFEYNQDERVVILAASNDQQDFALSLSEERYLQEMGYERLEVPNTGVDSEDRLYYRPDESDISEVIVPVTAREAVEESRESAELRFVKGVLQGVYDAFVGIAEIAEDVADARTRMIEDNEGYRKDFSEGYEDVAEAVQTKVFWEHLAEATVNHIFSAEGSGEFVGEMVASGGPLGKFKWGKTVLKESIAAAKVAAKHTVKGRLKAAQLPTKGKVRFVPKKSYKPEMPLPNKKGVFEDKFGNKWKKGPSRTPGQPFEWDVQLSSEGKAQFGWASSSGSHINVSLDGKITH